VKIPLGCILLARKILESEVWQTKPAWWLKVWIYILLKVSHKDNKYFKRGQGMFTRMEIFRDCRLSRARTSVKTVENLWRWLRKTSQITTQKTTRGIIISVVKYDDYQNIDNYKIQSLNDTENDSKNDTENNSETTQKQLRNDTIYKNVNNVKYVKKKKTKDTVRFGSEPITDLLITNFANHYKDFTGSILPVERVRDRTIMKRVYDWAILELPGDIENQEIIKSRLGAVSVLIEEYFKKAQENEWLAKRVSIPDFKRRMSELIAEYSRKIRNGH